MKIVFIGSGNVATQLGLALKAANHRILQVYGRSESGAKSLARKLSASYVLDLKKISGEADIYIVAVSDSAIKEVINKIRITDTVILHTSGSVPISVFEKKFKNFGVLYPVQTFSANHALDFKTVPVCIEANNTLTEKKIRALAKSLTKKIHLLDSRQRKRVHLSAVFANNFSNHLFTLAERILEKENISFDLLRPLILETAMKVQKNPPSEMQTGPAKRGDTAVIREHLKMLGDKKEFRAIYRLISKSIEEMSGIRM